MTGSELFRRAMAYYEQQGDRPDLMHRLWDDTPWMVSAFVGQVGGERDEEMRQWCHDHYGPQAWPIHGRPREWHSGGATSQGWTWFGFATETMMREFLEARPEPDDAPPLPDFYRWNAIRRPGRFHRRIEIPAPPPLPVPLHSTAGTAQQHGSAGHRPALAIPVLQPVRVAFSRRGRVAEGEET